MKNILLSLTLLTAFGNLKMLAQPGSLFTSFANGGIMISGVMQDTFEVIPRSITILPDNKIATSGYSSDFGFYNAYIAKYTTSGTLDATFGNGGIVNDNTGLFTQYSDIIADPDGKIVVSGVRSTIFSSQGHDCLVARYNQNGTPDSTFGTNGVFTTSLSASTDGISRIIRLSDGRYVGLSRAGSGSAGISALLMLTSTGQLDPSFGTGGIRTNLFSNVAPQGVSDITLSGDGKLLVLGGGDAVIKLVKVNLNGQTDSTFGNSGTITLPAGRHLRVNADSTIMVFGEQDLSGTQNLVTYKYLANGTSDATFGSSGATLYTANGLTASFNSLSRPLLYPDGRYMRAWRQITTVNNQNKNKVALTWFNANGSLSGIGEIVLDISPDPTEYSNQIPEQVVMDSNGDIFSFGSFSSNTDNVQFIVKYHGDLNTTSVPESEKQNWVVYPNPTRDALFISSHNGAPIEQVVIWDNLGRQVGEYNMAKQQMSLSNLTNGMYWVRVTGSDNQAQTFKVIKY